jgi:hypothetical protein
MMKLPSLEVLKKIMSKSILHVKKASKKPVTEINIGPGRYSSGPYIEDLAYLIVTYKDAEQNGGLRQDYKMLDNPKSLMLQQMVGIPARRLDSVNLNTPGAAKKLTSVFNDAQDQWKFNFEALRSNGTASIMGYKIVDVSTIGGNIGGLGGLFEL